MLDQQEVPVDGAEQEQLRGSLQQLMNQCCLLESMDARLTESDGNLPQAAASQLSLSEFLARISHEVRLPLSNLLGYANWLRDMAVGHPDLRVAVDAMQECGEQLSTLMDDIAEYARIESGEFFLSASPIDLRQLLRDIIQLVEPTAKARQLVLTSSIDESVPATIELDGCRVRQVLINLIVNAVRFTQQGEVTVRGEVTAEADRYWLKIHVADTGCGISPERLQTIFSPFPDLKDAAENGRKYGGLGLAVNYRLAQLLGGRIDVCSRPQNGSTFTLVLPLASAAVRPHLTAAQ